MDTEAVAVRRLDKGRVAVMLRESPFYAESGGQVSDHGEILGEGWKVVVDEVRRIEGRNAAIGLLEGEFRFGRARATVPSDERLDTERNHTATHLLHAALRQVLGDHVHQAGSLVAPDRLRFDFTHHGPIKPEQLDEIEALVNRWVWAAVDVHTEQLAYASAIAKGATALFGEKYGDIVRVVTVPGFSMELCGGTHVRNTSAIGLVRIVSETGIAAGVRRIEAATGARAFELMRSRERTLARVAEAMKATPETVERRLTAVLEERRALERKLGEARQGGGDDQLEALIGRAERVDGARVVIGDVQVGDAKELQALGDALRERLQSGIGVLSATMEDGNGTLLVIITDDLREKGMRADNLVRAVAAIAGGKGGGKPHMAQAGIPDASRLAAAMAGAPAIARAELERAK